MVPETGAQDTGANRGLAVELMLALAVVAVVASCSPRPSPTPTPLPSPTSVAPSSAAERGASPEVQAYLLLVRPVTSDAAIVNARWQRSEVLRALLEELEEVEPPPEMAAAHALLQEGYQLLTEGTAILETHPDAELRAEAIFTQGWGQRQLWEHRRLVTQFLEQIEQEQAP
jgi:hypothetical protein